MVKWSKTLRFSHLNCELCHWLRFCSILLIWFFGKISVYNLWSNHRLLSLINTSTSLFSSQMDRETMRRRGDLCVKQRVAALQAWSEMGNDDGREKCDTVSSRQAKKRTDNLKHWISLIFLFPLSAPNSMSTHPSRNIDMNPNWYMTVKFMQDRNIVCFHQRRNAKRFKCWIVCRHHLSFFW